MKSHSDRLRRFISSNGWLHFPVLPQKPSSLGLFKSSPKKLVWNVYVSLVTGQPISERLSFTLLKMGVWGGFQLRYQAGNS